MKNSASLVSRLLDFEPLVSGATCLTPFCDKKTGRNRSKMDSKIITYGYFLFSRLLYQENFLGYGRAIWLINIVMEYLLGTN